MPGGLCAIRVRPQRNCQHRFQSLHRNVLLIFHLHALGSESMNGHDACAEHRAAARFVQITLALLQQARIDGLHLGLLINLFSAAALQDHARNASDVVPHGKIRYDRATGQGEDIGALQGHGPVVRENLSRRYARMSIVDVDIDGHLFER